MSSNDLRIDRRQFLTGAAGAAGAAALGAWAPGALSRPGGPNSPIVTKATLGIQHVSVRDAINRPPSTSPDAIMGHLGGPTFPEDPTDLGPKVPLPGGYQEVFDYLGSVNISGFEFFQYTQFGSWTQIPASDPRKTPSFQQIRAWLDAAGMRSFGTHTGGVNLINAGSTRNTQIRAAGILGHKYLGTAGDPAGNSNLVDAWQTSAENFNTLGELMYREGLKIFFHPEGTWWQFFNDPDRPEMSRTHKIDYFAANTDPRYVLFEIDSFHMYNNRSARPDPSLPQNTPNTVCITNPDGCWDAESFMKRNWKRLMGYHIKDAIRNPSETRTNVGPYVQTQTRAGFPLAGGVDGVYSLEGQIGKGYPTDPDPNVIGFRRMFTEVRSYRAKGFKFHIIESDSGPGPTPASGQPTNDAIHDPGRSLRLAKISARNLLGLK